MHRFHRKRYKKSSFAGKFSPVLYKKGCQIVCKKSRLSGEGGSVLKIGFFYMLVLRRFGHIYNLFRDKFLIVFRK